MKSLCDERWVKVGVDKLVKANWNYKEDNDELKEKLKENIKRNGQIENIIVRELDTGFLEIVNGNHRYDAMVELGIKEVVVYNLGKISVEQAIRTAIETNETKFENNWIKYSDLIKEISNVYGIEDLERTLPHSAYEINKFIASSNFDWNSFLEEKRNLVRESVDDEESEKDVEIKLLVKKEIKESFDLIYDRIFYLIKEVKKIDANDTEFLKVVLSILEGLSDEEIKGEVH